MAIETLKSRFSALSQVHLRRFPKTRTFLQTFGYGGKVRMLDRPPELQTVQQIPNQKSLTFNG